MLLRLYIKKIPFFHSFTEHQVKISHAECVWSAGKDFFFINRETKKKNQKINT